MTLGHRLKKAREENRLLQKDVASKIGISHNTISQYENDVRKPDPDTLAKFADLFGVSADWLLGRESKAELGSLKLGERLKLVRSNKKLTQEELSNKLGIHRSTYAGYESGHREPDINTLQKLADFFEVSIDYLSGRTDDPRIPLDVTHEGIDHIRSWDIEKLIKWMEDLDELRHNDKPLSEEKKEAIVNFFKQIYLPGIIENETKDNGKENN